MFPVPDTLLTTKIYAPAARSDVVPRPRLIEQLQSGISGKLTLISAPAGFGKTSLARDCLSSLDQPAAWLSLDERDNDLTCFFSYLIAALRQIDPNIGRSLQNIFASLEPPPLQSVITILINAIAISPDPFVIVLDDYHVIREIPIHEAMRHLLDRQPPKMHLIITTRADPPLPLARLRAQGQMTEIRARHLRFTKEETDSFLNEQMGLGLTEDEVATLTARTEGWVAGLQLTALSLRDETDRSAFVLAFSGTDRYVMDYLVDEVLSHQSSEIQAFLLQTSILERLSGPLCDAILGDKGAGEEEMTDKSFSPLPLSPLPSESSQSILEYLEQANLFVVPLDNQREWYRYHHLFSEFLRTRLRRAFPDLVSTLQLRAADWCEQQGLIVEAVNYALAVRDWNRAASWVEQNARDLLGHGQMSTVMGWVAALPKEVARSRPRLCIELAWALAYANQLKEVEHWLCHEEIDLDAGQEGQERELPVSKASEKGLIQANVALLRGYLALVSGDPFRALEFGHLVDKLLPEGDPLSSGCTRESINLNWLFGYGSQALGELVRATDSFTEAVRLGKAAGDLWHTMVAMTDLGLTYRHRGQLRQAAEVFREIFQMANDSGVRSHGYLGRVASNLSLVLLEQNKLDEALHHARNGVKLSQDWQSSNHMAWAYGVLAQVLLARGDQNAAWLALQKADQAMLASKVLPSVRSLVETCRVRLWLDQGNLASAERWAEEFRNTLGGIKSAAQKLDQSQVIKLMALARILIAKGCETRQEAVFQECLDLLSRLKEGALQDDRIHLVIEIGALHSVAQDLREKLHKRSNSKVGKVSAAMATLENTLLLAEPEGYVRMFVDEGQPMAELIYKAASCGISLEYCGRLLAAFPEAVPGRSSSKMQAEELMEPLSERELEVLHLIAEGLSNMEIAQRLYLSINTVKGHTRNIYGKLQVNSRTQAVARARTLAILPPISA